MFERLARCSPSHGAALEPTSTRNCRPTSIQRQDLVRSGHREEAQRRARVEFGWVNTVKDECRQAKGLGGFDVLEREARYAARQLWRSPGFTATVVLTLALAIGANTAIFSLVNALLLNELPYAHPERIGSCTPERRDGSSDRRGPSMASNGTSAKRGALAASCRVRTGGLWMPICSRVRVRYVRAARVSAGYLEVLALRPIVGGPSRRTRTARTVKGSHMSYTDYWPERLGRRRRGHGRAVLMKGASHTRSSASYPKGHDSNRCRVYTALQPSREGEGGAANFAAVMRLKDGATWLQVDAELNRALRKTRVSSVPILEERPDY